jgi:hypothetical protein
MRDNMFTKIDETLAKILKTLEPVVTHPIYILLVILLIIPFLVNLIEIRPIFGSIILVGILPWVHWVITYWRGVFIDARKKK